MGDNNIVCPMESFGFGVLIDPVLASVDDFRDSRKVIF